MQPLSITLEVVMEDLARKKVELLHKGPVSTIRKLCKWQQVGEMVDLIEILIQLSYSFSIVACSVCGQADAVPC